MLKDQPNLVVLKHKEKIELRHEISINVVCATSKSSDQPALWSEPLLVT